MKVLPEGVAHDADRLARFDREAKTLAEVIHAKFGAGSQTSDVLEWALPIGRQIADALDAAHERGIIHRDLKPANIKVRDDGSSSCWTSDSRRRWTPLVRGRHRHR